MFKIRNEQVEALAASRVEDFEARLAAHLREYFPEEMGRLSPAEARASFRGWVQRSAALGLTSERAVACFAHVALLLGPDFEVNPRWQDVADLLRDGKYFPDHRAKLAMDLAYDLDMARGSLID